MDYQCENCDKSIEVESKNNIFESTTHIEFEKSSRINHTFKIPDFIDIDKKHNDYITNHNKKIDLYLHKGVFKLAFKNLTPPVKTEFQHNTSNIHLKRNLLYFNEYFSLKNCLFSLISEINFKTNIKKKFMTFEFYINQPMQMVELNINMIIAKNLSLSNGLD